MAGTRIKVEVMGIEEEEWTRRQGRRGREVELVRDIEEVGGGGECFGREGGRRWKITGVVGAAKHSSHRTDT